MKSKFAFILLGLLLTLSSCTSDKDKELLKKYKAEAEEVNKMTPMRIEKGITLDKAEALENKIFKYYYTFDEEPSATVDHFIKKAKSDISSALKATSAMKQFKEDGITLVYIYRRSDKTVYAELEIKPEEY